jgi:hypothetical protein
MATENRGVMVYLPPEIEEYITTYCTEYNITRKSKDGSVSPSLGTGIVSYLKSQILGITPNDVPSISPSKVPNIGLTKEEVLDLIQKSVTNLAPNLVLGDTPSHLPSDVLDIEELIRPQLEPITASLEELETYIKSQLEAVRAEIKKLSMADGTPPEPEAFSPPSPATLTPELSKDDRRWLDYLDKPDFRSVIESGISENLSNQEIVDRLFESGHGKKDNTEPYPSTLVPAMKRAYQHWRQSNSH